MCDDNYIAVWQFMVSDESVLIQAEEELKSISLSAIEYDHAFFNKYNELYFEKYGVNEIWK